MLPFAGELRALTSEDVPREIAASGIQPWLLGFDRVLILALAYRIPDGGVDCRLRF